VGEGLGQETQDPLALQQPIRTVSRKPWIPEPLTLTRKRRTIGGRWRLALTRRRAPAYNEAQGGGLCLLDRWGMCVRACVRVCMCVCVYASAPVYKELQVVVGNYGDPGGAAWIRRCPFLSSGQVPLSLQRCVGLASPK
jgi:hypothetical protein